VLAVPVVLIDPGATRRWACAQVAKCSRWRTVATTEVTTAPATDYQALAAGYLTAWNESDADARAALAERLFTDDVSYTDRHAQVRLG
jgi:hypothetical protein